MKGNGNGQGAGGYADDGPAGGQGLDDLGGLSRLVLGPAPSEAAAVLYTQLAHAVGLAMQNIVSQQQTMNTINNAIATKALNLLADQQPEKALEETRKSQSADIANALDRLYRILEPAKAAAGTQGGPSGRTAPGTGAPPDQEGGSQGSQSSRKRS